MKHRQREFEKNLEEGLVDFSDTKNIDNGRQKSSVVIQTDVYEKPIEEFDAAFVQDLKVLEILSVLIFSYLGTYSNDNTKVAFCLTRLIFLTLYYNLSLSH